MTAFEKFVKFLSGLNITNNDKGVYGKGDSWDNFEWKVAGKWDELPEYTWIGNLSDLSYGYQSEDYAFEHLIEHSFTGEQYHFAERVAVLTTPKGTIRVVPKALQKAYFNGDVAEPLHGWISEQIDFITEEWATEEAESFADFEIPDIMGW